MSISPPLGSRMLASIFPRDDLAGPLAPIIARHCFSGSVETARQAVKLGLYLGFGGSVTFKNARHPVEAAGAVPLDRLLLETDAPYMAPVPCRGKRNDSSLIRYVAEKIAEIRGISAEQVLNASFENARALFSI